MSLLSGLAQEVPRAERVRSGGRVTSVRGPVVFATIPHTSIGDLCVIERRDGTSIRSQVVSFQEEQVCLAPFDELDGISPGAPVTSTGSPFAFDISDEIVGRVVNCFAEPITVDDVVTQKSERIARIQASQPPPHPLERPLISTTLETGVTAIDGLCTLGYGQRVGLFAGAGVGKSTLLGMISRRSAVDISVIALIGERGREVREFLEESLGPEGMRRAVVVVATSDESPIRRSLAVETATAIAEYFRHRGKRVLLLVDSLTRAARALREVGLAAGELPIRQGYTASVYMKLPKLLERAGTTQHGSITGIYTVLTNGEVEVDPLGEEIKSILDGHIVLDSKLAERGVRPAIDLTVSVSRVMSRLRSAKALEIAQTVREVLSRLKRDRDLILFGGTPDAALKAALDIEGRLIAALTQRPDEAHTVQHTDTVLAKLAAEYRAAALQ